MGARSASEVSDHASHAGASRSLARFLIIETSGRVGQIALAEEDRLLDLRCLDETRRHARDLAPTVRALLAGQHWPIRNLSAVIVSRGPGSYTGLRVGVMSAKTLAFAIGCKLLAIDTFAAIARQAPPAAGTVEIIADAQQQRVYCQRFVDGASGWRPAAGLRICSFAEWRTGLPDSGMISGPGVAAFASQLPANRLIAADRAEPQCSSLLAIGRERYHKGEADDIWTAEPLYLRPSAAEQQWDEKRARST